mgnify:CR=1 FL=1
MAIDASGVKIEDRPFDQVRQEAIDQLIMNYSHGIISAEAFERRLDIATDAKSHQELIDVVADLTLLPDNQYQQQRQRTYYSQYFYYNGQCLYQHVAQGSPKAFVVRTPYKVKTGIVHTHNKCHNTIYTGSGQYCHYRNGCYLHAH